MMVKICGITNREDALAAVEAGASAIGFNFYRESPRYISHTGAAMIGEKIPANVWKVGVFVNETPETDGPDHARRWTRCRSASWQLGRPRRADLAGDSARPGSRGTRMPKDAEAVLIDTPAHGIYGGSGETWDWSKAQHLDQKDHHRRWAGCRERANRHRTSAALGRGRLLAHRKISRRERSRQNAQIHPGRAGNHDDAAMPDAGGHFGPYGGRYVPEVLMAPLEELEQAYLEARHDPAFQAELKDLLANYAGRPTPLYHAKRLSETHGGAKIYIKREDLLHTGAHKINNCLGQALLARRMGKKRIIAETGAGQHGVATATVCALFGLECIVYMGEEDMRRQRLNVFRMRLLGAKVVGVSSGSRTLKDAISEAMRDWVTNVHSTHYLLGSALGAHPYPMMVRDFHSVIGDETRRQILERERRLPDSIFACVGGGSNAIGMFHAFVGDEGVRLIGVEAGGTRRGVGRACRAFLRRIARRTARRAQLLVAGRRRPGGVDAFHFGRLGLRAGGARTRPAPRSEARRILFRHRSAGAGRRANAGAHRGNYSRARIGACRGRSLAPRARRPRASCS